MDIKNGNLITPKGASLIFGKEVNLNDKTELAKNNDDTYSPYTIVITTEEDNDNNSQISASEINFNNNQSDLSATTVQGAIEEIKTSIDELKTNLNGWEFIEYNSEDGFQIATEAIKTGKSLWIRIEANKITPSIITDNIICAPLSYYNLSADGETINYCDFKVSHEGYNKIIRLNIHGWELSKDYGSGSDVIIYRWEEEN